MGGAWRLLATQAAETTVKVKKQPRVRFPVLVALAITTVADVAWTWAMNWDMTKDWGGIKSAATFTSGGFAALALRGSIIKYIIGSLIWTPVVTWPLTLCFIMTHIQRSVNVTAENTVYVSQAFGLLRKADESLTYEGCLALYKTIFYALSQKVDGKDVITRRSMIKNVHQVSPGLSPEDAIQVTAAFFDLMDIDNNGYIDFDEFALKMIHLQLVSTFAIDAADQTVQKSRILLTWDLLDKDHSNEIDYDELKHWVKVLLKNGGIDESVRTVWSWGGVRDGTPEEVTDKLMKLADVNHDGKISREEFVKVAHLIDVGPWLNKVFGTVKDKDKEEGKPEGTAASSSDKGWRNLRGIGLFMWSLERTLSGIFH